MATLTVLTASLLIVATLLNAANATPQPADVSKYKSTTPRVNMWRIEWILQANKDTIDCRRDLDQIAIIRSLGNKLKSSLATKARLTTAASEKAKFQKIIKTLSSSNNDDLPKSIHQFDVEFGPRDILDQYYKVLKSNARSRGCKMRMCCKQVCKILVDPVMYNPFPTCRQVSCRGVKNWLFPEEKCPDRKRAKASGYIQELS